MAAENPLENDQPEALGTRSEWSPPGAQPDPKPIDNPIPELSLPIPTVPTDKVDKEVYAAWKKYMIDGFERNNDMFAKILDAFTRPYWLTVRMYQAMFIVGLSGVVLAAVMGAWQGVQYAWVFGGLSAVAFIGFFVSRPLISLEQNIQFITWLGLVYNTYWTRLMYANDEKTVQADLEAITECAIQDIVRLLDKQTELTGKRPDLQGPTGGNNQAGQE